MENKILTVVVPMYNVEKYITNCLNSFVIPEIMEQVEVLIIDDGSADLSSQLTEQYVAKYPETFQVIHKENGGHGSTINKGIELAKGKYFKVVDGDDWVDKTGFIHLVRHMEQTDADMILSNYYWVDHTTGRKKAEVEEICPGISYGKLYPFKEIAEKIFMKMHAISFKTEVLRNQPERLDEHCFYVDTEYMLFPLPFVKTVSAIPDFVYQYRIGLAGQSMSAEKLKSQCNQHEKVLRRLLKFYKGYKENSCAKALENTLARIVVSQYKIYFMLGKSKKRAMVKLDMGLKRNYPRVFKKVQNPLIKILRKMNYHFYIPASEVVRLIVKLK